MSKTQIINTEQGEELVVLTRREYDAMRARLGDEAAEDAMSVRIFEERAGAVAIPVGCGKRSRPRLRRSARCASGAS